MTPKEIKLLWEEAVSTYESLNAWELSDIEDGKNPEYSNTLEYMRDLGYWEGRKDTYSEML